MADDKPSREIASQQLSKPATSGQQNSATLITGTNAPKPGKPGK